MRAPRLGPRERQLLLACSRIESDTDGVARTEELLMGELDWDAVVWHARLHSVAPMVHRQLQRNGHYERLPRQARRALLRLSHRAAYQNRHFAGENRALVEGLRAHGIEVIIPKGLSLLEPVYRSLGNRPLIDLIFLLPRGQDEAAAAILRERGYARRSEHLVHTLYRWYCPQLTLKAFHEISVAVILFSSLISWPRVHRLENEDLWSRAEQARVVGADTWVLSPIDLVIYLCIQADNHGYLNSVAMGRTQPAELLFAEWSNNRLIRFTDLYETIRRHEGRVDWDLLVKRAREGGVREPVHTSLALAQGLLGPALPPAVLRDLGPSCRHRMRGWLFDAVSGGREQAPPPGPLKRVAGHAWVGLGHRRQIRFAPLLALFEFALPSLDALGCRYRGRSRAALVGIYPLHVLGVGGRMALALLKLSASKAPGLLARALARIRLRPSGRPAGA